MLKKRKSKTGSNSIEFQLKALKLEYQKEIMLIKGRQFRTDFFIKSLGVAIEFEGIMSTTARHTTETGYTNDCEKYNLISSCGYIILRYTIINVANLTKDLNRIINDEPIKRPT